VDIYASGPTSVFNFYNYLRTHPLIVRQHLATSAAATEAGSQKVLLSGFSYRSVLAVDRRLQTVINGRSLLYHTSLVKTTFKVYEKRQTLTLSQPKTPKPVITKFKWRIGIRLIMILA